LGNPRQFLRSNLEQKSLAQQLSDLFAETGEAHHQAYIETNGFDLEWHLWYADYMQARLSQMLNAQITKSELVYFLVLFDDEHRLRAPEALWTEFYAEAIVVRLTEDKEGRRRLRHRE
jgi:hypothetical protein